MENIRILCYGDSNTWGYKGGDNGKRYGINERWTRILADLLGNKFEIIEEGLNGRTLTADDILGRNGYNYLTPCLYTHDPVDLVILMLGTNELKTRFNKTAQELGETLDKYFVKTILETKSQFKESYPKLLIVTPVAIDETADHCQEDNKYVGATQKSKELNNIYKKIAEKHNCYFLNNEGLTVGEDGVHLDKQSHQKLAELLHQIIRGIYTGE
ncbi:MAG: GDSL-type esterase/lipase family protein [Oscillospiraceae bacterium]|nr:GDSL-type esterase/lipase family protein [Oscillospiraceae bacterium]